MSSIFTKIINGEIPSYKIAETDQFYAFLDAFPLRHGHTLVIPKREVDYIFDLEDEEYMQLMLFSKLIAKAIKSAFPCKKVGITVIGIEVPHAHIHLLPINTISDMNFSQEKIKPSSQELQEAAEKIKSFL